MSPIGTSLTSRDVRLESAKRANADIDQVAVGIVGVVWSIFVLHMAFRKKFHDFRIVLVRNEEGFPS
jgi:hypothetical protein